jgi:hypothetical protein
MRSPFVGGQDTPNGLFDGGAQDCKDPANPGIDLPATSLIGVDTH